jgi:hypothetical protein
MKTLLGGLKHKTRLVTSSLFITAATATLAVYAEHYANVNLPGSVLAQAVPVGISTVQQMLVIIWAEFSGHAPSANSPANSTETKTAHTQFQKGDCHANA